MSPIPFNVFSKRQLDKFKLSRAATMMGLATAAVVMPLEQIPFATDMGLDGKAEAATVQLKDVAPGTVINFAGYQWIVLNPSTGYMWMKGTTGQLAFDQNNSSSFNPNNMSNIGYTLNNTFYNSLPADQRALIQTKNWTTGSETNESASSVSAKVGLISYSEWEKYSKKYGGSAGFLDNPSSWVWTRTPAGSRVWVPSSDGVLRMAGAYDTGGTVRPSLYIDPQASISNGTVVANSAPTATDIPNQEASIGDIKRIDVSAYFSDPEGEPLSYSVFSSDQGVTTGSFEGSSILILTAKSLGSSTITVNAWDSQGASTSKSFTFNGVEWETVNTTSFSYDYSDRYFDYIASNIDHTKYEYRVIVNQLAGTNNSFSVTKYVNDQSAGTILSDSDLDGTQLQGTYSLDPNKFKFTGDSTEKYRFKGTRAQISLQRKRIFNNAPTATAISNQSGFVGKSVTMDMSNYFSDADGDTLSYSVNSSNIGVATASMSGNTLTLNGVTQGNSTITVTASDGKGGQVSKSFTFNVDYLPVAIKDMPAGSTITMGGYEWIVLNPSEGYIISKSAVDNRTYRSSGVEFSLSDGVGYYLNTTFYNSYLAPYSSVIQTKTWGIGNIYDEYSKTVTAKIALIGSNEFTKYSQYITPAGYSWTRSISADRSTLINVFDENGINYESGSYPTSQSRYVMPTLYLNPGTKVIDGDVQNEVMPGNSAPVITLMNDKPQIVNGTKSIEIKGNISDADGNNVTVIATINGKPASQTISGGNGTFTLQWNASDIAEGVYKDIVITANDGSGGTKTTTFTNNITVDKTPPNVPTFAQDITEITAKDVQVDASFSTDSSIKEYKVGEGNWQTYTGPITIKENTTISARAYDAAENVIEVTHNVTNIDDMWKINNQPDNLTMEDMSDADLNPANIIEANLPVYKSSFKTYKTDLARNLVKDDAKQIIDVVNSVIYAGSNVNVTNIREALSKVNQLKTGSLKDDFMNRLSQLVKAPERFRKGLVTSNNAVLQWDAAFEGATYIVERDGQKVYEGNELTFLDTGLSPNKEYKYTIKTVIDTLQGPSAQHLVTTLANKPGTISFTELASDSFRVNWDTNSNPTGTEYRAIVKEGDYQRTDSGWVKTLTGKAINLKPDKNYTVEIKARNILGQETEITTATVKTTGYVVNQVTNLKTAKNDGAQVVLTWDHGQTETDFVIEKYRGATKVNTFNVQEKTLIDTEVRANDDYTYKVIARNTKYGNYSEVQSVNVKIPYPAAPAAPPNLAAESVTSNSFTAKWDASDTAQMYYVELLEGNDRRLFKSTNSLAMEFTSLKANTEYTVKVYGMDVHGQYSQVSVMKQTTSPLAPPTNLTDFEAVVDGKNVNLNWQPVEGATGYYVERLENGVRKLYQFITSGTSFTDSNVPSGTHEYRIITYHQAGLLEPVKKNVTVTDTTPVQSKVENFKATVNGSNVNLTWDTLKGTVYGYYLERWKNGQRQSRQLINSTSYTDSSVPDGNYEYRVIGYTSSGELEPAVTTATVSANATTPTVEPVKNLASTVSGSTVQLTWDQATATGVYGYYVERYDKNGTRQFRKLVNTNGYTDSSVPSGNYTYKVTVYHKEGETTPVSKAVTVGQLSQIGTIQQVTASITGNQITLSWDNIDNAYGYFVERWKGTTKESSKLVSTNSYIDSNVADGSYTYKVIVYSKEGYAAPVAKEVTIGSVPQEPPPTEPTQPSDPKVTNLLADIQSNKVSLKWTGVSGAYGYYVERWNGTTKDFAKLVTTTDFIDSNVPTGNYTYKVVVYDKNGTHPPVAKNVTIGGTPEPEEPPVEETSPVKTLVEGNKVTLNWDKVDGAYGYFVERWKGDAKEFSKLTTSTSFVDSSVPNGDYVYKVIIYQKGGNQELGEQIVKIGSDTVTPPPTSPGETQPSTGISDVTSTVEGTKVTLNWNKVDGAYGYYVERWKDGVRAYKKLVTTNLYADSNVSSGNYTYKVIVYNKDGELPAVEETVKVEGDVTAPTPTPTESEPQPEPTPTPVSEKVGDVTSVVDGKNVTLTWNAINGVYGYFVERWKGTVKEFSKLVTEAKFADANVADGQYEYKVITYSKNGMADPTSEQVTIGQVLSPTPEPEQPQPTQPAETVTTITPKVEGQTVTLDWNDVNEVYGYYVEKWVNGVKKSSKFVTTSDYVETNVANGTYEYRIVVYSKKTRTFLDPVSVNVTVGV